MDSLTRATPEVMASQFAAKKPQDFLVLSGVGTLAGMAADLDVLIESSTDPLLGLKYHGHFTHSLLPGFSRSATF